MRLASHSSLVFSARLFNYCNKEWIARQSMIINNLTYSNWKTNVMQIPIDRSIVWSCFRRIACRVVTRIALYRIACFFMICCRRGLFIILIFTLLFTLLVTLLFTLSFTLGFLLDATLAYFLQLSGRYLPKILLLIGSRFLLEPFPLPTVTASTKSFVITMRNYDRLFVTPYCRASVTEIKKKRLILRKRTIVKISPPLKG